MSVDRFDMHDLDDKIFNDFLFFYDRERLLHKNNKEKSNEYNDSVVENIATLNPIAFATENGRLRIDYLYGNKSPLYSVGLRIKGFAMDCSVKYGAAAMKKYKERCLTSLEEFGLSKRVIRQIQAKHSCFWMHPLFMRAYNFFQYKELTK